MLPSRDDKITVTVDGYKHNTKLQLTLNWDANLNDWIDAFKTILIHQTFPEDSVKELFEDKEYCRPTAGDLFKFHQ